MQVLYFVLVFVVNGCLTQDPQDIADVACAYDGAIYEFNTDSGIIESPNYPNYYDDNEFCQWFINPTTGIPEGQRLFLEVDTFETENGYDELWVYEGEGVSGDLLFFIDGYYYPGTFFTLGDEPVTLYFTSDSSYNDQGFRVSYFFGEASPGQQLAEIACGNETRPAIVTNTNATVLETIMYPADHPNNTECEWIIQAEDVPEGLYLDVIYFYAYNYLYIYFDDNSDGEYETYWYGSYSSGYGLYNPGSVMTLKYDGYYTHPGFKLVYYPVDPACTSGSASEIAVDDKGEIKSPAYPYTVPEHLSCRWLLRASENQKVLINSLDQNLYGDGIDCGNEYVEVLDGDIADAVSLGKYCGNISFGSILSSESSLQVYFRSHETSSDVTETHTGFAFNFEPV